MTTVCLFLAGTAPAAEGTKTVSADSPFAVKLDQGALVSLKHRDADIEYLQAGRRLGDALVRFRQGDATWQLVTNGDPTALKLETRFATDGNSLVWTLTLQNLTGQSLEIGDLALPLPISRGGRRGGNFDSDASDAVILKHGLVCGHGSFLFWMRSDLRPPNLVLVPTGDTKLEYWEGSREGGYRIFLHSAATGAEIKARGANWRQPHTSLTLAPKGKRGDTQIYEIKFRWATNHDEIRQVLVDEGSVDVHVVPGMTVPTDLFAEVALRTKQKVRAIEAEFPKDTKIESLGRKDDYRLYRVRFSRLGENRLTVRYGDGRHMVLEFFSTEPLETLIKKRAAFLARSQHRDPAKWYNGLITDWNLQTQKLISPDDYAPIPRNRYYAVTCDDPGLGKPAFLAAKNAEFPVQSEVEALDYYIKHFVWGGLQRTTEETYPYAIYGIPDWKTNRESSDAGRTGQLHIWREYDYPHVILMYFAMYRLAKHHPEIKTELPAEEYLRRAYGTANAFFTVPHEVWSSWSPYGTGFYNELVIVHLIDELEFAGLRTQADTLRSFWERKVRNFVNRRQDLFRSEYAFDTTGFESTHALAKYAMQWSAGLRPGSFAVARSRGDGGGAKPERPEAGTLAPPAASESGAPKLADSRRFLETQMAANLFCRGVLEPAYYYLGSDFRGSGGNAYTLTYMAQMGGWSVLDYALNFATNRAPYLRLGYASYLSAWALVNSGTPESNYGYWFPGAANDGGAGGGFEPSANGRMWLAPAHPLGRGAWNFACEIDLGYCGALRTAATILADDPIFGRFCFGGDWRKTRGSIEVVPKDGLRRRFFAVLGERKLALELEADRFAATQPIKIMADFSQLEFTLESDNPNRHTAELRVNGLAPGIYMINDNDSTVGEFVANAGQGQTLKLAVIPGPRRFAITRAK